MWATVIFGGMAALFVFWTLYALWHLRWVRRLPALEPNPPGNPSGSAPAAPIRCSVIIAARNEASRIESTVRHVLGQRGVGVELIVVDDRSTDRTGEILQRIAKEDVRLRVMRVGVLPDGWLGKCHACHIGASAATAEWILFTDADCWLKPDVIARALRVAHREAADHITLTSGLAPESRSCRASHLLFLISLANWFSGVNRDWPKAYVGIGAFNLVRADVYRRSGGYEALRLTVVDDVKLGLLLRRAGGRTRGFVGGDDAECHWGESWTGIVRIMEKNYFAAIEFRTGLALAIGLTMASVFSILAAGLLSGTVAGLITALSPSLLILPAGVLARRLGWSWREAVLTPCMFPLFLWALLNSTFVTLRQGGIRWRDTFYPLEALRAGNVR